MAQAFPLELQLAELAVQRAVLVTRKVLANVEKGEISKSNKTPVSLADFAAQALLVATIHGTFPSDTIIGEEDTSALRGNAEMTKQVWELVSSTHLEDAECERILHSPASSEEMLHLIDLGGKTYSGSNGRVWMIDPVDGTKGFLDGGQYVVCATLCVDGIERVAAFGCPHINVDSGRISEHDTYTSGPGYLVSAVKGAGAHIRPLSNGSLLESTKIDSNKSISDFSTLRFAENHTTASPQFSDRWKVAEKLGAKWDPIHIFSTQLRYIALALGTCDVVLRTPQPGDAASHVWDHAGGAMIFVEAGGKVTDLNGKNLVFTAGRNLTENFGLVAAPEDAHARILEATQEVFSGYPEYRDVVYSAFH